MKFSTFTLGLCASIATLPISAADEITEIFHNLQVTYSEHEVQCQLADLNADNKKDLLIFSPTASTAYYANADGSYDGPHCYGLPPYSSQQASFIAFGKTEDQVPDGLVFVENAFGYNGAPVLSLLSKTGDSPELTLIQQISHPFTRILSVADLNADGYLDILGSTDLDHTHYSVQWGNNLGLSSVLEIDLGDSIEFIDQIDFSGNGLTDIVFNTKFNGVYGIHCIKQTAPQVFNSPSQILSDLDVYDHKFLDLNGDGLADLWSTHYDEIDDKHVASYLIQDEGQFSQPILHSSAFNIYKENLIDLGNKSILISPLNNDDGEPVSIQLFPYDDVSTPTLLSIPTPYPFLDHAQINFNAVLDLNDDTYPDLLFAIGFGRHKDTQKKPQLYVSYGSENGFSTLSPLGTAPIPQNNLKYGDFNGDQQTDIITQQGIDGQHQIFFGDGNGGWTKHTVNLMPDEANGYDIIVANIAAADISGNGADDLFVTYHYDLDDGNIYPSVYNMMAYNDGSGNFTLEEELTPAFLNGEISHPGGGIEEFIDMDNDGLLDAVNHDIGWHRNLGGYFSKDFHPVLARGAMGYDPLGNLVSIHGDVFVQDFDNDGNPDVLSTIGKINYDETAIWPEFISSEAILGFTNEHGVIDEAYYLPITNQLQDALGNPISFSNIRVFDFNSDSLLDILYFEPTSDALGNPVTSDICYLWLNSSDGRFQNSIPTPISLPNGFPNLAGDYNGDGDADLATARSYISSSINGPKFSPVYSFISPYESHQNMGVNLLPDIDGDYDADFLISSYEGYYSLVNPLVDSARADVQHALAQGLRAEDTQLDADPDGDGISNQLEYLFGGSMIEKDEEILPTFVIDPANKSFMGNARVRSSQLANYIVEVSSDMENWQQCNLVLPRDEQGEFTELQQNIEVESELGETPQAFIRWSVK